VRSRWQGWLGGGNRQADDDPDPIQTAPDHASITPDVRMVQNEATEELMVALQTLPERQLQAFMLRTWEGMSVAATAQAMGCSGGSVKTHLSRALNSLRKQLEDHWP